MVVKNQAVQPGKSGAYNQVELKNIIDGTKLNERFRASGSVERIRLQQKTCQFLYKSGDVLVFMDAESYEQIELSTNFLGERAAFLEEGMRVTLEFYEERPIGVSIPNQVVLGVVETEPTVKGQTAASSYKPAIFENQIRVTVPPFVGPGERIVVDTNESVYVRRAE